MKRMSRIALVSLIVLAILAATQVACLVGGGGGGGTDGQATADEQRVQTQAAELWRIQLTAQAEATQP